MAIAFDFAVGSGNGNLGGGTTRTWSHTCSGANGVLFVVISAENYSATWSATYNGVAMTSLLGLATVGSYSAQLFYLLNPPTGAHNVIANLGGAVGVAPVMTDSVSYNGVAQTGFPDSASTPSGGSSTTFSPSTTVVSSGSWLFAVGGSNQNSQCNVGSATTLRTNANFNNGNSCSAVVGDSNGGVASGVQHLNFTSPGAAAWLGLIVSMAPVPSVNGNFLAFM